MVAKYDIINHHPARTKPKQNGGIIMKEGQKAVVWFKEVTKNDIPLVGGKGANLGEMTNAGIPVPPGFIVTASAYFDFIEKTKLHDKIKSLLDPLDVHDSKQLQSVALKVQKLVMDAARGIFCRPAGHLP
jgi:hypothetical protein